MKAQKILIVEDDVFHRAAMEKVLQVYGYETFSCESGEHAVVKMKEESFGILITDFLMRGMDGLELIREARSIKPEISAILVTGLATEEMRVKAAEQRVSGFFPKPVEWDQLVGLLDTLKPGQWDGSRSK
jgi:two-component system, response regulator FlrC